MTEQEPIKRIVVEGYLRYGTPSLEYRNENGTQIGSVRIDLRDFDLSQSAPFTSGHVRLTVEQLP